MSRPAPQRLLVERNGGMRLVVAPRLYFAKTALSRMRGLLGRKSLEPGEALWIEPCNSIHTFFMQFAIDAAFLDAEGRVRKIVTALRPWRATAIVLAARAVVELEPGTLERSAVQLGDRLLAESI